MKLWQKDKASLKEVENYCGKDSEMDMYLAAFDVLGSLAHMKCWNQLDLLTKDELAQLQKELKKYLPADTKR